MIKFKENKHSWLTIKEYNTDGTVYGIINDALFDIDGHICGIIDQLGTCQILTVWSIDYE